MISQTKAARAEADFGFNFLNTRVAFRCSAVAGQSTVSVHEHWMPFGDAPPLHRHADEDEIFHVLSGTLRIRVGETEVVAKAGDTLVAPKGVPHTFRVLSAEGSHCLVVTNGADFEAFVRELSTPAASDILPAPVAPTPAQQQAMAETGHRHGIEILGPPLAA